MSQTGSMPTFITGGLECALLRRIYEACCPEKLNAEAYKIELCRPLPDRLFSRVATIVAISNETELSPRHIRPLNVNDQSIELSKLIGVREHFRNSGPKIRIIDIIREMLADDVLTDESKRWLGIDAGERFHSLNGRSMTLESLIHDIVQQVFLAGTERGCLFLAQEDQRIYVEVIAALSRYDSRFAASCFRLSERLSDPDGMTVSLLSFDPPDLASIGKVRQDSQVRRYAESVRALWNIEDPIERDRRAVAAMRAVVAADDAKAQIATVFEATAWWLKPLSWAAVPGASIAADARDGAEALFNRRRRNQDWLLIRPRMQDISLRDYLRRKGNY